MKLKPSELTGAALNHAVGVALNLPAPYANERGHFDIPYSTSWGHGGPIIEREGIDWVSTYYLFQGQHIPTIEARIQPVFRFENYVSRMAPPITARGETRLIAAMRCFVASKLGDEVEIPEELCVPNK